jgi:hypothetical protein
MRDNERKKEKEKRYKKLQQWINECFKAIGVVYIEPLASQ